MNYLIDLETLSTHKQAAVIQVGLAVFDHNELLKSHLWIVDNPVGHIDPDTVKWWFSKIEKGSPSPFDLTGGMHMTDLSGVLHDMNSRMKDIDTVWANSPSFDLVILQFAYEGMGIPCPWIYKHERDVRTLAALCPDVAYVKPEIFHNAESDARAHTQWVLNMLASLRR